jgi:CheY-like chemotaxis protein
VPGRFPAIIVVEDAPDILIVLRRVLHDLQLEYDIITVDNGLSALAQAGQHPCALLITDYMLSGINGLELAREFKARWRSAVIMITAYATPELRDAAKTAGVDRFLSKPFMVDDLEAAVCGVLSTRST